MSNQSSAPAGWYPGTVEGQQRYWDGTAWTDHVRPAAEAATEQVASNVAAGWYADERAQGTERYWDGNAWSEQTRPSVTVSTPAASVPGVPTMSAPTPAADAGAAAPTDGAPPARAWFARKRVLIPLTVVAGLLLVSGISVAATGGGGSRTEAADEPVVAEVVEDAESVEAAVPETAGLTAKEAQALLENAGFEVEFSADSGVVIDRDNWTVLDTSPAAGVVAKVGDRVVVNVEKTAKPEAAPPAEAPQPAEPAAPDMTLAQKNAVGSAKSYLSYSGFSRFGLLRQLTSEYGEGFTPEDAEFALAHLEQTGQVDWNAEAVESAESYLRYSNFSRQGLFEQLTSEYGEGFTAEQAEFALNQIGL